MPQVPSTTGRRLASRGFTLTELVVTLTIVAVMAAMSVPSFQCAIEQSRADIAVANLRAIWAAERLYWLEYRVYTTDVETLQNLGVLDSGIPASSSGAIGGYHYEVSSASTATSFTAKATHVNDLGSFTIDHTGHVSGAVTLGAKTINPGFQ